MDGIHMLGNSGRKFYMLSVLNILRAAQLTSSEHDYHQSCAQYQYQTRQQRGEERQGIHTQTGIGEKNFKQQGKQNNNQSDNVNVSNQQSSQYYFPTNNRFQHFC